MSDHVAPGSSHASSRPTTHGRAHIVSDGGTRPFRIHLREPSFVNLQALPVLVRGGLLADVIACVASVDSLMGGCDR